MNRLRAFWHYVTKVFDLPRLVCAVGDQRQWPVVPTAAVSMSLLMGAVLRVPSFLQLQQETGRRGWQRLVGWKHPISDDVFDYVTEHYRLEDWRSVLVEVNTRLKSNKALESAKISGLLVVALDANEQFNSRSRCCPDCCQRTIREKDSTGQEVEVVEYYHRQVYAQLHGPQFSLILDLEPILPGEDEAQAALRLLGRMRRLYGPRFFDVITVDAWYATGPFLRAVQLLGWAVVTVLKQQRYEIYQEASALHSSQPPLHWKWEDRQVDLWEVKDLPFTEASLGTVRVVLADERWPQTRQIGGQRKTQTQSSHWRWLATRELDAYPVTVIWRIGHQRWGVENHAFNELTQHYHLTHCPHHHPTAIMAWLLILVLGFNLFELFVRLHGKLWRMGKLTLQQVARQLDLAMEHPQELEPLRSG